MELLPGDRLGKYEVVGRLAAGGMAEVYLANSLGHGGFAKRVALKRMLPSLAAENNFRSMFMQEAAVAARLSHPNIVQMFDFAEESGELYLAMEFVHGVTLKQMHADSLARSAARDDESLRVPVLLAAHIARDVARALGYAWQVPDEHGEPSHLIHRDVSPQNVLLSYHGDVKLADFGIAKPADRNTSVGVLKGKVLYMAPEQLACKPLDSRTDTYALGIVLYEVAVGLERPLLDSGTGALLRPGHGFTVTPPHVARPGLPESLSAVIMKAIETDPSLRFQSAGELADALGECIYREAQGPFDYDVAAFMRRLYGEPPPIRGIHGSGVRRGGSGATALPASGLPPAVEQRQETTLEPAPRVPEASRSSASRSGLSRAARQSQVQPSPEPPKPATKPVVYAVAGAAALACVFAAGMVVWRPWSRPNTDVIPMPPPAPPVLASPQPNDVPPVVSAPSQVVKNEPAASPSGEAPIVEDSAGKLVEPSLSLDPKGSADAATPVTTTPEVAAASGGERLEPARRPRGRLLVHITPWAYAWLDNEKFTAGPEQEAAPLRRTIAAGRHVLHLKGSDGVLRDQIIVIGEGRETRIEGTVADPRIH